MEKMEKKEKNKPHVNIMFIGQVNHGKSCLSGNILYLAGMVDERTIQKLRQEAMLKGRDSWFLSYIMDSDEEEKDKGKTIEVGRAHFQTSQRRYTLLDSPGHQAYVPNMIIAAAQADIGILVISARQQEFERGFERGGQTREHALIAKTLNVEKLLVAINKMDESTVQWSENRFNDIVSTLSIFLKKIGFKNIQFIPVSGLTGENLFNSITNNLASWYKGPTFIQALDDIQVPDKDASGPIRVIIINRFKEKGRNIIHGKVESGTVREGDSLVISPTKEVVKVVAIENDFVEGNIKIAIPNDNVYFIVKGIDINNINVGNILSDPINPAQSAKKFRASVYITNSRETNPIFCAGSTAVMHIHTMVTNVTFIKIVTKLGPDKKPIKDSHLCFVKKGDRCIIDFEIDQIIACETYDNFKTLSTFTLRDESLTLAIGKVIKILN